MPRIKIRLTEERVLHDQGILGHKETGGNAWNNSKCIALRLKSVRFESPPTCSSNGPNVCNCRCNGTSCASVVTAVPPPKLAVRPPVTVADIAPKSASVGQIKASAPASKAIATTVASQQLKVMRPVTAADFTPELSNPARGTKPGA